MIFFYSLISVMPLMRHPIWSEFVGELTAVKYLGAASLGYAILYLPLRKGTLAPFWTSQARWFLAFALLALASYLAFGTPVTFRISPFFSYLSFLLLFFVTVVLVDSRRRLRWVLLVAVGSVTFASLHLIREYQRYGSDATFRPGWVTGDSNYFSMSALVSLPLAFYLVGGQPKAQWEKWFYGSSLVITTLAMALAASRGGFVGLMASMAYVTWRSRQRFRRVAVVGALIVPTFSIVPYSPWQRLVSPTHVDDASAASRLATWSAGLRMVADRPLTGVGLGNFQAHVRDYVGPLEWDEGHIAHNVYIEIAAEMGVASLLMFLGVLWSSFRSLERVRRAAIDRGDDFLLRTALGIQSGLLGFSLGAVFISAQYQKLFWLMVFVSMCLPGLMDAPAVGSRLARRADGM